jgi:valyl-tRNA synthetase
MNTAVWIGSRRGPRSWTPSAAEGLAVMTTETVTDADGNETTRAVPLVENKPIMQPFGDRSKVVIEPMLTDQWFVDTAKIVGPCTERGAQW